MKLPIVVAILAIILSIALSGFFYAQFPEQMAVHWNINNKADGFMQKDLASFLIPAFSIALLALFLVIPKIDPLKKNIEAFMREYQWLIAAIMLFMLYIHALTLAWNLGKRFDFALVLMPAFALLFYYLGAIMPKFKRNWFVGIRTPWTLSSERVWDKTHALGSKLFKISAAIAVVGLFFSKYAIVVMVVPIVLSALYLIVYSYFEFRKEAAK